ncbi:MAG: response regulator [Desulfatiglans sp.]|nr:response regulator [Thermodesulfobacteriota bacterium]MEE4352701.1 response regulator [Desulfatiglans sp.]
MTVKKEVYPLPFVPRILVVDDEKRIRQGCQKTLTLEGFEVALAESGDLAVEQLKNEHFDIILLDLMMPGLSGMDVLAHVKALHPDTVIIVITGYATLEHAIEAMKKGAFDFISKPFSPQDLRNVVAKAIEYIRTLEDIATEKSRVRVLINHLSGGVMATDAEKKIALANPAFLRMMNYRDEAIGKPVAEVVRDIKLNQMIDQALSMPKNEFTELTAELDFESKGDEGGTVLGVRCIPFRDRVGRTLGSITALHDITTQKKIEQLKSDFVSMVAHEIRSPMNSVMAQLKVVLDGLAGEVTPKQNEILSRASEKIEILVNLSSELLDLSRIESGLITQEKEKLDISEILSEQVVFYETLAQEKDITLNFSKPDALPTVMGNRYNMEEVFSNLIGNAIKYTPPKGRVLISAVIEKNNLCISVGDNGFGIPEDEIDKVFDRFYRVKNDKTRNITGTGLGLSIVKSIVKAHDGMVNVVSEVDHGTTFSIYIPIT